MAFQSVPDCAEAVIQGTLGSKQIVNVLNFARPGGYVQADITALATAVDADVATYYRPTFTAGAAYVQTTVRGLALLNDLSDTQAGGAGVGGVAGASLPNNVSFCVTLRTGYTGRSARGKFFAWPTGSSNLSAANTYNATYGGAVVTFLEQVAISAGALGWNLVIVSRRTLGAARPTGVYFDVTSIAYRNLLVDSQRGRLPVGH